MKYPVGSLPKTKLSPRFYLDLPENPGVYIYFKDKTPIYIGKAINLKKRVASYFRLTLEVKTKRMIEEADAISYIKVVSELEALLLEARLIRKYMPHYNIAAKDDKHPLYIIITKEKYPRVLAVRKLITNNYKLIASFGPFPASNTVRSVLRMIRRIFPYSDHKQGTRGCLYSHIGLCDPCPNDIVQSTERGHHFVGKVLRKKYLGNIKHIKSILSGKFQGVKTDLVREMKNLSKEQRFEEAGEIRNKVRNLDYITQPQMPTEFYMQNPNLYEDVRKKELSEFLKILNSYILNLKSLARIECFDIAHLAGSSPTASMVTFIDGVADKTFYRHFKIKKAKGGDDYDSMREVAKRRVRHLGVPTSLLQLRSGLRGVNWGRPNLIIVDGGEGQVKAFTSILYSNEVNIPVVGIAKNPDRLVVGDQKIKLQGGPLQLVSRIRDEAHRFARRYHHKLVSRELIPK